ncbi:long-chain fatty acid--CoA ligase [Ectothiorhodospiraceae bacterium WFHF3C12]|nr:long-chain fatty acid--CoA ligase [Ectothiorhodospiraceae bacterium WFHF3C12]
MSEQATAANDVHFTGGIGEWLRYHREQHPQNEALIFGDTRLDYGTLNSRVNRVAQALAARGVDKGDRVSLLMLNSNAFLETFFACAKLGAIAVPLNFRLSPGEISFILADAGARVIVYHPRFTPLFESIRGETALEHGIAVCGPDEAPLDGDADYERTIAEQPDAEPQALVRQDDPLMMMYTSGTTGKPKGAVLTHANPTWITLNTQLSELAIRSDENILTVAPLFHIGGLAIHTLPALHLGGKTILHAMFDPEETLRTIERERVGALFLLPAMWQALTQVPNFDDYDLSSLRYLVSGGSPCPIPVIEFFQGRGLPFIEGFGMTETTASACVLGNADAVRKNGSVGKPLTHVQMRIVDEDDNDVAPGETGELVLRGPSIFKEYWNRPEATADDCRNGWFHSGDLARQDEEGFYYIVDRKKDMLISGGENVYPTEVEQVLYKHPKVQEVAVIGVPDERWGEVPMALVVPPQGETVTLEEIEDYCRDKLARFKTPKHLAVLEELPRTATGKVLKRELRQEYAPQ